MPLTEAQASSWADWLNQVEAGRRDVLTSVLEQAGLATRQVQDQPELLLKVGKWIQRWFSLAAAPYRSSGQHGKPDWWPGFFQEQPQVRLGGAWAPSVPSAPGYSASAAALLHAVALDLAFLVCDAARASRPGLRWRAAYDERRNGFFLTPDPDPPPFEVIRQIRDFLVQSVARPRGGRGQELREWRGNALYRCYERAVTGIAQPPDHVAFPGADEHREGPRYVLSRPLRTDPVAPIELVDAVTAFRQAGWYEATKVCSAGPAVTWFQASKLTTTDLARTARTAWKAFEREDIPLAAGEIAWRLLVLDSGW